MLAVSSGLGCGVMAAFASLLTFVSSFGEATVIGDSHA
jgi:hypothetical protein